MFRNYGIGLIAVSVLFFSGCDGAKPGDSKTGAATTTEYEKEQQLRYGTQHMAERVKEKGMKIIEDAEKAIESGVESLREGVLKHAGTAFQATEAKIKELAGEEANAAKEKFAEVQKLVEEFKSAPADKLKEMGDSIKEEITKLKTMVGL